jgi:hypothetical protein
VADGIVVPEKVPGFWTYPKSAGLAKGDEDAKPNEKVMMYIAGGLVLLSDEKLVSHLKLS